MGILDVPGITKTAADGWYAPATLGLASPNVLYRKIRGGNITVKPGGSGWQGMWAEWDWTNWIKPQIDRAVLLGMNTVRVIGSPECVLKDPITTTLPKISQSTYLARWQQLADYCLRNGLYLYPSLLQKWDFIDVQTAQGGTAPWNFQESTLTGVVTASAQTLSAYANVIGFDVFQEGDTTSGLVLADILAMYAAVRAVAPRVPLTTSDSSGNFGSAASFWNNTSSLPYQAYTATGGADFVDLHVYLDSMLPSDVDGYIKRLNKPILIGEFGDSQDQTQGNMTARFQAMAALHNRRGILGSLVWALADQSATNTNMWGVWDNTGFSQSSFPSSSGETPLSLTSGKRTYLTNVLPTFNIADVPETPYQPSNLLTAAQSHPVNATTGWATGANTYLFTDARGLGFSATASGTTLVSTTPVSSVPVAASTYYTASASLLAGPTARTVSLQVDWYDSSASYISSSTAVTGTDNTTAPLALSLVVRSASTAAYGVMVIKVTATEAANEAHIVLAYPQPFIKAF